MPQVSHISVEYMRVYSDAAANLSESVSSSVSQGRHFIEGCAKLDERMVHAERLLGQVRGLKEALTALETNLGLPVAKAE